MIVQAAEQSRAVNDAWKIARWQADENRKAIEQNKSSQKVSVINKIDFDHIHWVNKNVFGKP